MTDKIKPLDRKEYGNRPVVADKINELIALVVKIDLHLDELEQAVKKWVQDAHIE